jgi:hypothetical protein
MRLLDNLRDVSPTTYPKHPVVILTRITSRLGLSSVRFCLEDEGTPGSMANTRFRGRARVRNIWLSSICYGASHFSVRTKCAEEALQQLRHDPDWLNQISSDEEGRLVLMDIAAWTKERRAGKAGGDLRRHDGSSVADNNGSSCVGQACDAAAPMDLEPASGDRNACKGQLAAEATATAASRANASAGCNGKHAEARDAVETGAVQSDTGCPKRRAAPGANAAVLLNQYPLCSTQSTQPC